MSTEPGTVAAIMNPKLLYIREGDPPSYANARARMGEFGVTAVPILDAQHRPIGLVTAADLERWYGELPASGPVVTVGAQVDVREAARKLAEAGVHQLVVVDDDGVALGIVSATDFARVTAGLDATHPSAFGRF